MVRSLAGDRESYAALMTELGTVIEGFVSARFGARKHGSDFIEECVQEALLTLHRVRHTWDPRQPFRPWLFAIVRHKVIDILRRREVRRTEHGRLDDAISPVPDPSLGVDAVGLLALLEPAYRDALVLTKLEGYSLEEAAASAGVSIGAMKTRVHRAVRMVQRRLREETP